MRARRSSGGKPCASANFSAIPFSPEAKPTNDCKSKPVRVRSKNEKQEPLSRQGKTLHGDEHALDSKAMLG
eukprot:5919423-Amphidinium_carterae.1